MTSNVSSGLSSTHRLIRRAWMNGAGSHSQGTNYGLIVETYFECFPSYVQRPYAFLGVLFDLRRFWTGLHAYRLSAAPGSRGCPHMWCLRDQDRLNDQSKKDQHGQTVFILRQTVFRDGCQRDAWAGTSATSDSEILWEDPEKVTFFEEIRRCSAPHFPQLSSRICRKPKPGLCKNTEKSTYFIRFLLWDGVSLFCGISWGQHKIDASRQCCRCFDLDFPRWKYAKKLASCGTCGQHGEARNGACSARWSPIWGTDPAGLTEARMRRWEARKASFSK